MTRHKKELMESHRMLKLAIWPNIWGTAASGPGKAADLSGVSCSPVSREEIRNRKDLASPPGLSMRGGENGYRAYMVTRWKILWPAWRQGMFPGMRWKLTNGSMEGTAAGHWQCHTLSLEKRKCHVAVQTGEWVSGKDIAYRYSQPLPLQNDW